MQVFLESNSGEQGNELEREFFILRKLIEKERDRRFASEKGDPAEFYICTLSNKLIVYKVGACHAAACVAFQHARLPIGRAFTFLMRLMPCSDMADVVCNTLKMSLDEAVALP